MKRALLSMVVVALAGSAACAPKTSMTEVWSAPAPVTSLKSVLVFGVNLDDTNRRVVEDAFARDLTRHGVRAAPSYDLFPGPLPAMPEAREKVASSEYEGVLVLRAQGTREEMRFIPENDGFWNGYYGGWATYGGSSGYVTTDERIIFESTLWDLRGKERLAWTAHTETLNPTSSRDFAKSLMSKINPELTKAGFLPPATR